MKKSNSLINAHHVVKVVAAKESYGAQVSDTTEAQTQLQKACLHKNYGR